MTEPQAKELVRLQPSHFCEMFGALWFDDRGLNPEVQGKVTWDSSGKKFAFGLRSLSFWMLEQMPLSSLRPTFDHFKTGDHLGFTCDFKGCTQPQIAKTREDAVIEAYIEYLRSQEAKTP